jgi:hypothetical protein
MLRYEIEQRLARSSSNALFYDALWPVQPLEEVRSMERALLENLAASVSTGHKEKRLQIRTAFWSP